MGDSDPEKPPQTQPDMDGGPPFAPKMTARAVEDGPPEGESILDEIERRMRIRFPNARVQRKSNSIAYIPNDRDGFIVRLTENQAVREKYIVHFAGSSESFSHRNSAILQFALGISTECRIREYSHGLTAYRWVVEIWDDKKQSWKDYWDCISWLKALMGFWRRPTVRHFQNHLIDLEGGSFRCAA